MDTPHTLLKSKHLLIVEDDPKYRSLLQIRFEHLGIKVSVAASCKIAFSILRAEKIDLILLDIYLTDELSLDLPIEIERQKPMYGTPKIIAMSGVMSAGQIRMTCEKSKIDYFFRKPIELELLIQKMCELLDPQK